MSPFNVAVVNEVVTVAVNIVSITTPHIIHSNAMMRPNTERGTLSPNLQTRHGQTGPGKANGSSLRKTEFFKHHMPQF